MHPRLDEIRKRLLNPPVPSTPPRYKAPARSGTVFSQATHPKPDRSDEKAETKAATMALNSSETGPLEDSQAIELAGDIPDQQVLGDIPRSPDGLAQAVAELFEPARQCRSRLLEITQASEAITYLTRLALDLREPLKSFHDHIRKLSSSFESMRTFRDELGVLAESFAPVRALHHQVIQMAGTVRSHLAEVADGLEPAKALQIEIADLSAAIDSVTELQARFYELSEAFGDAAEGRARTEATAASAADSAPSRQNKAPGGVAED